MRRILTILSLGVVLAIQFSVPQYVAAAKYEPYKGCGDAKANYYDKAPTACSADGSDPLTGSNGVIVKVTKLTAMVAGIAAIIMIMIGSFKYITSNGDSNNVQSAKNTILYAVIGLAVAAAAPSIVSFVLSKL